MNTISPQAIDKKRLLDDSFELLEVIPEAAIIVDASDMIVRSNIKLENLFGYTHEELQGSRFDLLIPERYRTQHIKNLEQFNVVPRNRAMGRGHSINGLHKSGREIPIEIKIGSHTTEQGAFIVALITDVTDCYWTEEHLKEREDRLGVILASTNAIPWAADPVTRNITYIGSQSVQMLGYPVEQWYEKDFWVNKIYPEDRETVIKACIGLSKAIGSYELEYRMVKSDGDIIWFHDVVNVEYKNGEPWILKGFMIDITNHKQAEQDTSKLRNELAHINRVAIMGELTASIAHEINQPLAAIMSNAQAALHFLETEPPDIEEVGFVLTDIISDNRRAGEVIRHLRGMLLNAEPERTPLNINDVIVEVVKFVSNEAMNKGVSVVFENKISKFSFSKSNLIIGNKVQIQQVALNIMLNAFDALAENEVGSRKLVIRVSNNSDNKLTVEFIDNGVGFTQQDLDQLFDAFYTSKQKGMGMGLTISRSIIEANGGEMGAKQNSDGGATVYFSLPENTESQQ